MLDIAAGVTAGILLAGLFIWCAREVSLAERDGGTPPLLAIGGMLFVLLFVAGSVYLGPMSDQQSVTRLIYDPETGDFTPAE